MNAASILVLAVVVLLMGLALRRVLRKGTPCLCDHASGDCPGNCAQCRIRNPAKQIQG